MDATYISVQPRTDLALRLCTASRSQKSYRHLLIIIERVEIEIGFKRVLKSKHDAVWHDEQRKKIEVGLVAKRKAAFNHRKEAIAGNESLRQVRSRKGKILFLLQKRQYAFLFSTIQVERPPPISQSEIKDQATAEKYQGGRRSSFSFREHIVMGIAMHIHIEDRGSRESRKSGCPKEDEIDSLLFSSPQFMELLKSRFRKGTSSAEMKKMKDLLTANSVYRLCLS